MRTTKRRDTLRVFGTGLVATLAGCGSSQSTETTGRTVTQPSTQTATPTVTETPNETATQTATSVPRVVWRQTVGNYLKSSPAVVDGTVFVGSHARTVSALAVDDGTEQWTVETNGHVFGGPTVVDGTVYVGTEEGLYAITAADGSIEWRTDLWNIRSQPTVRDDTVYVGSDDTRVYALDIETGTVLWQSQSLGGHHAQILCSPAVVDDTVVVGTGDRAVVALDAETGRTQWRSTAAGRVYANPVIDGDTVYVGDRLGLVSLDLDSGEHKSRLNAPVVRGLTRGTRGLYVGAAGSVVAVSPGENRVRWEQTATVGAAPAVDDGTVYAGTKSDNKAKAVGGVVALDAESGEIDWQTTLETSVRTDPAVTADRVVVGTIGGDVIALER